MNNNELKESPWDGLHEECGVFGMYDFDGNDVASSILLWSVCITAQRTGELWYCSKVRQNGPKGKKLLSYKRYGDW